ncbi:Ig-like domain-containing protein [Pyxidicoccus sp. 3LFB2]
MNSPRLFVLPYWVAVLLLSSPACIQVPDIEPAKAEVRITSPEGVAYTNGVLEVRLSVTGHAPDRVELLQDGEVLAEVEAPYTYAWDTAAVAEGTHALVARAVFGDVVFASEAREVVVDRTPPQVVSRTPEPGAQDVWVKSPIQAVFSEPVKVGSLTEASVRLTVGTVEVARTVSVSADGRTVTVVPGEDIKPPKEVSIVLSDVVADLAGNTLAEPSAWSWFHPYMRLAPHGPSLPQAAGRSVLRISALLPDGNGGAIIARTEQDSTGKHLRVYKQTGSEWLPLGGSLVFRDGYSEIDDVTLKHDPIHNTPIITWHEGNGSNESERIYVARWTGSDWDYLGGTAGAAPDNPYSTFPSLTTNDSGDIFVAFTDDSQPSVCVHQWSGSAWSSLGSGLNSALGLTAYKTVSVETNAAGNPIVAVMGMKDVTLKPYIAEWTGSEWRPFGGVAEATSPPADFNSLRDPHFMLDPQGKPVLAWISGGTGQGSRAHVYAWDENQWKIRCQPFLISDTSHRQAIFQMGTTGTVWLAWNESGTPTFGLAQCSGGTWSFFASSATLGTSFASASVHAFTTAHVDPFLVAAALPDGSAVLLRANEDP